MEWQFINVNITQCQACEAAGDAAGAQLLIMQGAAQEDNEPSQYGGGVDVDMACDA
jgi:hypothetical protein